MLHSGRITCGGRHDICRTPCSTRGSFMIDEKVIRLWMRRIQSEFFEMPGLRLTKMQAQRLWSLDSQLCDTLLDALVSSRVLEKTTRDAYVLAGSTRY